MLVINQTLVIGFLGNAFTQVACTATSTQWKQTRRSLKGPTNIQRCFGLFHRHEYPHYTLELTNGNGCFTTTAVDVRFDTDNALGRLTITLPQTVGPRDVPPGTAMRFVKRKWEKLGFGIIPRSQWPKEMLGYGGCKSPILDYDGESFTEIYVEGIHTHDKT